MTINMPFETYTHFLTNFIEHNPQATELDVEILVDTQRVVVNNFYRFVVWSKLSDDSRELLRISGRALRLDPASFVVLVEDYKPPAAWNRDFWLLPAVYVRISSPLEMLARQA